MISNTLMQLDAVDARLERAEAQAKRLRAQRERLMAQLAEQKQAADADAARVAKALEGR